MKLQCKQCSGTDFKKLSDNEYKCNYCGTVEMTWYAAGQFEHSKADKIKVLPFVLMIFGLIAVLLYSMFSVESPQISRPESKSEIQSFEKASSKLLKEDKTPIGSKEYNSDSIEKEKSLSGTFENISEIPDSIGNVYFIGFFKNTGEGVIRKPVVNILLYSKDGRKVAVGSGYGFHPFLRPGEKTPIRVLISKAPEYTRYEVKYKVKAPYRYTKLIRPKCEMKNAKIQAGKYGRREVAGELYNLSDQIIKYAKIAVVVYGEDKKIIGYYTKYLAEKELAGGDYSPFRISLYSVKKQPKSFQLFYTGRY